MGSYYERKEKEGRGRGETKVRGEEKKREKSKAKKEDPKSGVKRKGERGERRCRDVLIWRGSTLKKKNG